MKLKILAFGIAKDIFGSKDIEIELEQGADTAMLKRRLEELYPRLKELASYMVAVNEVYAQPGDVINKQDEIAIIPPVSGG